jgi:ATP synthase protein I
VPEPERLGPSEDRKLRHRGSPYRKTWIGFAYFGMVGWSVALPILAGAALGSWLDRRGGGHGWALSLLMAGAALGCWNAWRLVAREGRRIGGKEEGHADE